MSEFLKPQSPLQHKDGAYVYPLTTADQVLLDDNTRLNAVLDDINTKIDNMDFGDISIEGLDNMVQINLDGAVEGKPQNPLQHKDGTFIYPLTTADQVVLEDNNRLNFALEHLVYVDEEHQESAVVPLDADTLGGKPASEYATKNDIVSVINEALGVIENGSY